MQKFKTKPTLHISTLLSASSISSLRESTFAAIAWLLDLVAWYHLQTETLFRHFGFSGASFSFFTRKPLPDANSHTHAQNPKHVQNKDKCAL